MKKYLFSFFLLVVCFTGYQAKATATGSAIGSEIAYVWLHDTTYQVFYHLYRDCRGIPEPTTILVCYKSDCGYPGGVLIFTKLTTVVDDGTGTLPKFCPNRPTQCASDTSTIPGYREWWYQATVALSPCNSWTFSHAEKRSVIPGNMSTSDSMLYVEATINTEDAPQNSSVYFTVKPSFIVCNNVPTAFNFGSYDINNDSLHFECITPLTGSNCSPVNITYASGNFLPGNPVPCNNTFLFDSLTGQMYFTPSSVGAYDLTMKVSEYRKIGSVWTKVGSVMRDMVFYVLPINIPTPTVTLDTSSITGGSLSSGTIVACTGSTISFSYDCKTSRTGSILSVNDNHKAFHNVPTVTYKHTFSDSVHGAFTWVPSDTGLKIYTITITDSTCIDGVMPSVTYAIPMYIHPATNVVTNNSVVCHNSSISLHAVGGSAFTWGVLPGGSPVSSLSCTTCSDPVVMPTVNTYYILSATNPFCYNKDTILVKIDTIPNKPTVTVKPIVCENDTLKLTSSSAPIGTGFFWSGPLGYTYSQQNAIRFPPIVGDYKHWISDAFGCTSDTAIGTVSSFIPKPAKPVPYTYKPLCTADPLNICAYFSDTLTSWMGPGGWHIDSSTCISRYPPVAGKYKVWVTDEHTFCHSDTETIDITLTKTPSKPKLSSNSGICEGDNLFLHATDTTIGVTYLWTGPHAYSSVLPDPFFPSAVANLSGRYKATVSLNGCTASDSILVVVNAAPHISDQPLNTTMCYKTDGIISVVATGTAIRYQWQVNTGSGFYDLVTDVYYSGANTAQLYIKKPTLEMNNYKYRCIVSGICAPMQVISNTVVLTVINLNTWTGLRDNKWSQPNNWSCGIIPAEYSHVYIPVSNNHMPVIDIPTAIAKDIDIEEGATLSFTGTENALEVKGDFIDAGHGFDASSGKVIFSGATDQLIPATEYYELDLASFGHKILQGDITVDYGLGLKGGMLVLNKHKFKAQWYTRIFGGGNTSYLITDKDSRLIVKGAGFFNYDVIPIGTSDSSYTPITIVPSFYADSLYITVYDSVYNYFNHELYPFGNAFNKNIVNKTWFIDNVPHNDLTASITFQWNAIDELNGFNRNSCYLSHYDYPNWKENIIANVTGEGPYQLKAKVDKFGNFAIGGPFPANTYSPVPRIMTIYPDPAAGSQIFIKFDKALSQLVNLYVRDLHGRDMQIKQVNPYDYPGTIIPVDVASLAPGMYIITLEDVYNNNERHTMRFVKE